MELQEKAKKHQRLKVHLKDFTQTFLSYLLTEFSDF